jgi:phospholipase/carboxylesterase
MLHGRRGDEDRMWVFARAVPADWLVVAPRGPVADVAGGWSWRARRSDEWPPLAAFDEAVAHVVRFVSALPDLYGADPDHLYLMGFSQGAATAYATAMRHPGLVRGVAGLVGFVPGDCDDAAATAPLRGLPVFMAVGRRDPLIPFDRSRACAVTLRAAGARLEAHDYDEGHRLSAQAMRDLAAWWSERDLAP